MTQAALQEVEITDGQTQGQSRTDHAMERHHTKNRFVDIETADMVNFTMLDLLQLHGDVHQWSSDRPEEGTGCTITDYRP